MEIIAIIGAVSLGVCLSGTIVLLIAGSDTLKVIKILTWISILPLIFSVSMLTAAVKENAECKVKYKKVNVELFERVK